MITKCLLAIDEDGNQREFFSDDKNYERLIEYFLDIQHIMHTFTEAWLWKAEMNKAGFLTRTETICPIEF